MSSFCKCKNIIIYAIFNDQSLNDTFTNDIISFEQLGPDLQKAVYKFYLIFQLQVMATKVFANGMQTAYATVNITILRNLFAPVFDRQLYEVTVQETLTLGSTIVQLTATDQDAFVSS